MDRIEKAEVKPRQGKYKRPPIQEAVCEIHFKLPQPLDKEALAKMQPGWQALYPQQDIVAERHLELRLTVEKMDATQKDVGHKLIARSADGKNLAQLGRTFVAVNRVALYLGWEESFRDTILERFWEVQKVFQFDTVQRIGLRYINRIDFPERPLRWKEWFALPLPIPAILEPVGEFQSHYQSVVDGNLLCHINLGTLPVPTEEITSVILDIDVTMLGDSPAGAVAEGLERVHRPHRQLFEAYLLDKTRNLFHIST